MKPLLKIFLHRRNPLQKSRNGHVVDFRISKAQGERSIRSYLRNNADVNVKVTHLKIAAKYHYRKIKLLGDNVKITNFDEAINIHLSVAQRSTDVDVKVKHFKKATEYFDQQIKLLGDDASANVLVRAAEAYFHVSRQPEPPNRAAEYSRRAIKELEGPITTNDMLKHFICCVNDSKPQSLLKDIEEEFNTFRNTEYTKPEEAIIYKIAFAYLYVKNENMEKAEGLMDEMKAWATAQTEDFSPIRSMLGKFSPEDLLKGCDLLNDPRLKD